MATPQQTAKRLDRTADKVHGYKESIQKILEQLEGLAPDDFGDGSREGVLEALDAAEEALDNAAGLLYLSAHYLELREGE